MKREKMKSIIDEELNHIPREIRGSPQNMFRLYYYHFRRIDLAREQKGKEQILRKAIEYAKKDYPGILPKYDKSFFI